jgi:hypothetical protein
MISPLSRHVTKQRDEYLHLTGAARRTLAYLKQKENIFYGNNSRKARFN